MKLRNWLLFLMSSILVSNAIAQNVGVGISNPQYKLHVFGGDLFLQSSHGKIRFGYTGGNEWQLATTGAGADLRWYTTTDGGTTFAPRHYFSQNGNVGIGGFTGGTPPNARLEVIGSGTTSSTNILTLRNGSGDTMMRLRDDGRIGIGYNGSSFGRILNVGGSGINLYTANEAAFGGAVFPTDTSLIIWSNSGSNNYLALQPSWGNTGIGTFTPNAKLHLNGAMLIGSNSARIGTGYSLSVDGKIICEELRVDLSSVWPDYVFEQDYNMIPLQHLEQQVMSQKHLPGIPSAGVMEKQGSLNVGDMQKRLLEKVEELYRYVFTLNNENIQLRKDLDALKNKRR